MVLNSTKECAGEKSLYGFLPWAFLLWALVWVSPAHAYEALTPFPGGHLTGTVTLLGPSVPPKRFNLVLNPDPYYCGRVSDGKGWRLAPMPQLGPEQGLGGAIVYLQDVKKGKPFPDTTRHTLKLQNCLFIPHTDGIHTGVKLHIENWDPVQHHLEVFLTSSEGATRLYGSILQPHPDNRKSDYLSEGKIGTPRSGPEKTYHMNFAGVLFFRCNYHEYMEGWSVVLPHPYYAKTRKSGEFGISDIPPGSYILKVWHPQGKAEKPVHINAHDAIHLNIQLSPPMTSPQQDESSEATSFGIDLVGDTHIVPTVEQQKWEIPAPIAP